MSLDYELSAFTVRALSAFRDGSDPSRGEQYRDDLTEELLNEIDALSDYDKSVAIIDLLTLLNAMEQVVSIMQVNEMEKGLGQ